jgi:hypothetical protein
VGAEIATVSESEVKGVVTPDAVDDPDPVAFRVPGSNAPASTGPSVTGHTVTAVTRVQS